MSVPEAIRNLSRFIPNLPTKLPPTKTGMGFGWYIEGENLRADVIVPLAHILEIKNLIELAAHERNTSSNTIQGGFIPISK